MCTALLFAHAAITAISKPVAWQTRFRRAGRLLFSCLGVCGLLLVGLVGVFWLATGKLPRYDLYLSLIITPYLLSSPVISAGDPFILWAPVEYFSWESGFFTWLLVLTFGTAASAAVVMGLAARIVFPSLWTRRILLLMVSGLLMSPTLILNTHSTNLLLVCLPFVAGAIGVLSLLMERRKPAELVVGFLPTALLVALFLAAFLRPSAPIAGQRPSAPYTTLASAALSGDASLRNLGTTLSTFCDPVGNACRPERPSIGICRQQIESNPLCIADPAFEEISSLVQKWNDGDRALIFHNWQSIMLFKVKSRHTFPVSWTMVEGWSAPMVEYILETPTDVSVGDFLFVSNAPNLPNIDRLMLEKILESWETELVEQTENFSVLRLTQSKKSK